MDVGLRFHRMDSILWTPALACSVLLCRVTALALYMSLKLSLGDA